MFACMELKQVTKFSLLRRSLSAWVAVSNLQSEQGCNYSFMEDRSLIGERLPGTFSNGVFKKKENC